MNSRLPVLTLTVAVLATTGLAGQAKPASLQGVWKTVEVTLTGPNAKTMTTLQPNLTVVSAKYYARVEVHSEGPRPNVADVKTATADELRAVWGPFVAEAGTYELAGDSLTVHPLVSKNPAVMVAGAVVVYSCKLKADSMTLTVRRNKDGPVQNPPTIKLVRVE